MSASVEFLTCLRQLVECEERKQEAIVARRHAELADIVQTEQELLTALDTLSRGVEDRGGVSPGLVEPVEQTLEALQRICATNGLLLEELLYGVEICLALLQGEAPTYTAGEDRGRPKSSAPAVYDIRA